MLHRLAPLALALPLVALACTGSDDTSPDTDTDTDTDTDPNDGAWLVGDAGTMLDVDAQGEASGYALDSDADLLAIACFGHESAYVVGDAGTVLRTRDAGQTWTRLDPGGEAEGAGARWTALAVAEATPEGRERVWIVGHEGAAAQTSDGGASWSPLAGIDATLTGVATHGEGARAIAVGEDGWIWQLEPELATPLHHAPSPLHAVSMSGHGEQLAAVGEDGLLLTSEDAGHSWSRIELDTTRDLYAVRVSAHAQLTLAVGEAGVIARVVQGVPEVTEFTDAQAGLYGLHLRDDGSGQAVGGQGILLRTTDAGASWVALALATTATLRGVDDFHVGGHL